MHCKPSESTIRHVLRVNVPQIVVRHLPPRIRRRKLPYHGRLAVSVISGHEHDGGLRSDNRLGHVLCPGLVKRLKYPRIFGPPSNLLGTRRTSWNIQTRQVRFQWVGAVDDHFARQIARSPDCVLHRSPRCGKYNDVTERRCACNSANLESFCYKLCRLVAIGISDTKEDVMVFPLPGMGQRGADSSGTDDCDVHIPPQYRMSVSPFPDQRGPDQREPVLRDL